MVEGRPNWVNDLEAFDMRTGVTYVGIVVDKQTRDGMDVKVTIKKPIVVETLSVVRQDPNYSKNLDDAYWSKWGKGLTATNEIEISLDAVVARHYLDDRRNKVER